jgi:hypothetical protein
MSESETKKWDKWEWDRNHIKEYREKHEPYNHYEAMIMDLANRPFSPMFDSLTKCSEEDKDCWECKKGKVKCEETVLPSGLKIIIRTCSNPNCCFFEKVVVTDEHEILDFEHKPHKEWKTSKTKFTKEELKQLEPKIREIEKLMRKRKKE